MPIYEYQCRACEHQLEAIQKISDEPLVTCPACGKPELRKLISAAGFRLKGGGWYETDFKTGNKKNVANDKSDSGTSDSTNTSTSTASGDGKPAAGGTTAAVAD